MEENYRNFQDKWNFKEENLLESQKLNTYFRSCHFTNLNRLDSCPYF
jgi:hypothetical protein